MNNSQQMIVDSVAKDVEGRMTDEGSGHDWWHVYRVWKMAQRIGPLEGGDMFVIELATLLHDIADWKFHNGDDSIGPKLAGEILNKYNMPDDVIKHVQEIIATVSFKGAGVKNEIKSIEGKIVQDADRLDAIGAMGIARTFVYGGHKNRIMYDPKNKPTMHQTKESYMTNTSPCINHFYEKLLLLKDMMNTESAKKIAEKRHQYMEAYLAEFYKEWEGQD